MRNLKYVLAATAIGGMLGAASQPSFAAPLISAEMKAIPYQAEPLVQKIHGWHCRKRYGWRHGHKYWHRHRRACYDDDYDYHDDYDNDYYSYSPYYYPYPYFSFYFDDDHHHRHHHKYKKYHKMRY
jgi:hypothetical protein